jgi:hypothetical protein
MDRIAAPSLKSHLGAAFTAALLLGLCQIVIETLLIAVRFQHFIVSPHEFARTQMYDYGVKLFLLLPGGASLVQGGALDRFLPDGFTTKLIVSSALLVPNLIVGGLLALLLGCVRYRWHRPASVSAVLWTLLAVASAVHLFSYLAAIHVPKAWTVRIVVRNAARVLLRDGTWIAITALALAGACAAMMARLRPGARWVAAAAAAVVAAVFIGMPSGSVSSAAAISEPAGARELGPTPQVDNVVLISIDSLRADHLGCYGNPHDTSPVIDGLARQGVRFTNAMSATSWTLPSHASMLTGRYLLSHGVISSADQLSADVPTLAETLQRAGLSTGGVVSSLWLQPRYGFKRGFDYYDDSSVEGKAWWEELTLESAPNVTSHALSWLQQQRGRRFFLFVHFWDVHYDYSPPAPYDKMFDPDYKGSVNAADFMHNKAIRKGMPRRDLEHVLALYDGEIRWVDDHVAKILTALDELGLSDRTAVIVTADHGDEFFEHGGKGHQRTLYREVMHVPLIMRVPGITGGRAVEDPVSLVDVMPTVLDLTRAMTPPGVDGRSLVPALMNGAGSPHNAIYGWLCNPARKTDCKAMQESAVDTLIHVFQPPRVELYSAGDPAQRTNLVSGTGWGRHERLSALSETLNSRWKVYRSLAGRRGSVKIDKATEERLRALGYTD